MLAKKYSLRYTSDTMEQNGSKLTIPVAIVFAGVLIAGAVFISRAGGGDADLSAAAATRGPEAVRSLFGDANPTAQPTDVPREIAIRALDETDRVRGNPDAALVIVEYSDTECPFCKRFHTTLQQLIAEYGKSGNVAWAYRYFPLATLHPKAPREAEAFECARALGGVNAFWKYADRLFEITPANNGLDLAELPNIAEYTGLDRTKFTSCLEKGASRALIEKEYNEAAAAGGSGTPFSVFLLKNAPQKASWANILELFERYRDPNTGTLPIAISPDGLRVSLSGALPYEIMKSVIDTLLR